MTVDALESKARDDLPVLIVGAGISGLLLAQQLRQSNVPFQIFERDNDFTTRGLGWGLTLHWSLPALRECLPEYLFARFPEAYVDRLAVEAGACTTFPFYDLSTGELKGASPRALADERVRVTRERFRQLLATDIDIQWNKAFRDFSLGEDSVTITFQDNSTCKGRMLFGCDGSHSKVRWKLIPERYSNYRIPVSILGFTMTVTTQQAESIRKLDPFSLQVLKAPEHLDESDDQMLYQICISGATEKEPFGSIVGKEETFTNEGYLAMIKKISESWAEPFRSFLSLIPKDTEIKLLRLDDFVPVEVNTSNRVVLLGDASHAMTMYRGEGANHAIVDVMDVKNTILPSLRSSKAKLRDAMDHYEKNMIKRARPAVLAARKACLDAHSWASLKPDSPLLTRRQMFLDFDA